MSTDYFFNFILISNIFFFALLLYEFSFLELKNKNIKWKFLISVLILGYITMFFFLTFKRKFIVKRKFSLKY